MLTIIKEIQQFPRTDGNEFVKKTTCQMSKAN